jgi:hypothetical protein
VHLKLREHACPYCPGVAYQTKSTLKRHIETVHEKRRDHACLSEFGMIANEFFQSEGCDSELMASAHE